MSFSDETQYYKKQEEQLKNWEALCKRCGACCGKEDENDYCEHLIKIQGKEEYVCEIYENRFGLHKTRSGKNFSCVPLRKILDKSWPGDSKCAYKNNKTYSD